MHDKNITEIRMIFRDITPCLILTQLLFSPWPHSDPQVYTQETHMHLRQKSKGDEDKNYS
ncbi:hypothetical protein C1H46_019537 [Malus baccata]|uniref:Uncharacterized protein n=1 Tax=Malus baccata TaxID=106549 RepID=A0A540M7V2_MALBA|nr:hypothetical protein C1H46_019537 [Malus baccata]